VTPDAHRIITDGRALVLHDWGGAGRPILLAHPTGFHGRAWGPVADALTASGHHVRAIDFRGHGDSDPDPDQYRWHGFGDDVLAVVDEIGAPAGLIGVGHSMGGAALLMAELDRPGTFAGLYCFEPIVPPLDVAGGIHPDNPMSAAARRRRAVWDSPGEAEAAYASKPPLSVMRPDALRAYVEYGLRPTEDGRAELKCRPEDEAAVFAAGGAHDTYARLTQVGCPVVIARGTTSGAQSPEAFAGPAAERIPGGRLEVLDGLGHFAPQEDPDRFAASVERFVALLP
jgi:pimeloyl-ACP methyl ester carboxylesterase